MDHSQGAARLVSDTQVFQFTQLLNTLYRAKLCRVGKECPQARCESDIELRKGILADAQDAQPGQKRRRRQLRQAVMICESWSVLWSMYSPVANQDSGLT